MQFFIQVAYRWFSVGHCKIKQDKIKPRILKIFHLMKCQSKLLSFDI